MESKDLNITKLGGEGANTLQSVLHRDFDFISQLYQRFKDLSHNFTNDRQSFGNVLARSIAMNVAAEESEIHPAYEKLGEKGKELLKLAQFQCKQVKEALKDANSIIVSQARFDETMERLYTTFCNHFRQLNDSDLPIIIKGISQDECGRIGSRFETALGHSLTEHDVISGEIGTFVDRVKRDHKEMDFLVESFKSTDNLIEQQKFVNRLIRQASQHVVAEELEIYPLYEKHLADGPMLAEHARKEHQVMKNALADVDMLRVGDERFPAIIEEFLRHYEAHKKPEEEEELPKLLNCMSHEDAVEVGKSFDRARRSAPTHPHPMSSSRGGIAQMAACIAAKPLDALRDALQREV
ncbi:hypothetical protein HDV05_007483 [Chytridiales sp. JEL 0842]|nr:hypothetical protein HDV05_007483 [Chytridiales sp. JEL 0842]